MLRTALLLFLLLGSACLFAQDIRDGSIGSAGKIRRIAKERGFPWPYFTEGDSGTAVFITFDFGDADITVLTEARYTRPALLKTMQGLANHLDMPRADYILHPPRGGVSVDMEMNDYLVKPKKLQTKFSFPIGKAVAYLESSDLPKPIVYAVECADADKVLISEISQKGREFKTYEFFHGNEIPEAADASFQIELPRFAYVLAWSCPLFILAMLAVPIRVVMRLLRSRGGTKAEPEESSPGPVEKKSLEEVQAEYQKRKMSWLGLLPICALILVITMRMTSVERVLNGSFELLPVNLMEWLTNGLMLLVPVGLIGMCVFMMRTLRRKKAESKEGAPADPPILVGLWPMFIGMLLMISILAITRLWPNMPFYRAIVNQNVTYGILIASFVASGIVVAINSRKNPTRFKLKSGDKWFDRTMELARQAGVRVLSVSVVKEEVLNAYATPWNTVGMTQGLIDKLEEREVDAVIAHELGHHKMSHAKAMFVISLALVFGYIFGLDSLRAWLSSVKAPEMVIALFRSPLPMFLFIFLLQPLLLGWSRRRNEYRADAFAAKLVGDSEVMVSALMKMAYENQSPTELKPMDELLGSHPSVAKRVAALRAL